MVQVTMISDYLGYKAGQTYWVVYSIGVNMLNNGKATYVGGAGGGGGTTPVPVTVALTSGSPTLYSPTNRGVAAMPKFIQIVDDSGTQIHSWSKLSVSPYTITIPDQGGNTVNAYLTLIF
jgi:hypothetical protein